MPQSGRSTGGLLLAMALLGGAAWMLLPRSQPAPAGLDPELISNSGTNSGNGTGESNASATPGSRDLGTSQRASAPKFVGRGSIRGLVTTATGSPVPTPFTVHVGPSQVLVGRRYAEPASAEFMQPEFDLPDLPLGGYDVWIEAEGMNSLRSPILLTQAAQHPYIVVRIAPMGYLDGFVVNEDGRPAQDLRVELAPREGAANAGQQRLVLSTRPDGYYMFEEVPDGEYDIFFGPQHSPLVPVRELLFTAPKMHFQKLILPPAVDIQVRGTDGTGKPLANITVSGFGKPSGRIEVVTDERGLAWARNLPPGRYRVLGEHPDGMRAKMTFVVKPELDQQFTITVR